jgi:CRISPR-associated protein Cmr4
MQNIKPFFIKVITPLHAGSGSDLGVVDLPIQRESHTSFPKIEASSLKGSIRSKMYDDKLQAKSKKIQDKDEEAIKDAIEKELEAIFGKTDEAGKLGFSDARILFFPVKSVKGVFAYVTCPMVLNRFEADVKLDDKNSFTIPKIDVRDENCIVLSGNKNIIDTKNVVILEEYSFTLQETKPTEFIKIPNLTIETEQIVIISDDNFKHFVQNSTEVITRIKIDNGTGTVEKGGLFTEEYLPSESVMYALAIGKVEEFTKAEMTPLQIGGNTTLGKGIVDISCEGCPK